MRTSTKIIFQTILSLSIFYYLATQGEIYYPEYQSYIKLLMIGLSIKVLYTNIPILISLYRARFDI
jgi:hypothetical protein